jgi:hypothetical protein
MRTILSSDIFIKVSGFDKIITTIKIRMKSCVIESFVETHASSSCQVADVRSIYIHVDNWQKSWINGPHFYNVHLEIAFDWFRFPMQVHLIVADLRF